jgi:hypothetical protein
MRIESPIGFQGTGGVRHGVDMIERRLLGLAV